MDYDYTLLYKLVSDGQSETSIATRHQNAFSLQEVALVKAVDLKHSLITYSFNIVSDDVIYLLLGLQHLEIECSSAISSTWQIDIS